MYASIGILIGTLLAILYFSVPAIVRERPGRARSASLFCGADLLFNDGRAAYWKKQYQDAIRMLRHAARIRPERAMTHHYLGLSYAALGDFSEAERAYREALRRDPLNANVWSELGDVYRRLNRWEDAIDAYRQALNDRPDLVTAQSGLDAASASLASLQA